MRGKCLKSMLWVVLLLAAAAVVRAEDSRWAAGGRVGTTGVLGEITFRATDMIDFRLDVGGFAYSYDGEYDGVDYDTDFAIGGLSGLIDVYPFDNGFRISGGAVWNWLSLDGTAKPSAAKTYNIGGVTYTGAQLGSVDMSIDYPDVAPYVGIGFGRPFGKESKWSWSVDLGVMYVGEASVDLSGNPGAGAPATYQADLDREASNIEDDLADYQLYPVITFGVVFRF